MNEDLKELGITPDEDMEENDRPGEVVNDQVATGDVGDNEDEDLDDELSLEDQKEEEEDDDEDDE